MKRKTIQNHKDFLRSQTSLATDFFILKIRQTTPGDSPRYGVVASKRVFKLAVQRNRAKRLLRDWIAFNEHEMRDDIDYIFIARFDILCATRDQGRHKMHKAIVKVNNEITK